MTLLGEYLKLVFLSLGTIGIYSFWGRTNVRRYLMNSIELMGDRFAYHGTGGELFIGWLKGMGVFLVLVAQLFLWPWLLGEREGGIAGMIIFYLSFFLLIPIVIVSAMRYRLSRTSWRGIRFSFTGRAGEFMAPWFGGFVLTVITLGIYLPYFSNRTYHYLAKHTFYGDVQFDYDGKASDLMASWVLCWILTIPTLTLSSYWFSVRQLNYQWDHTRFGVARFRSQLKFLEMLGLAIGTTLCIVITLGLGLAWAQIWNYRYYFNRLFLEGELQPAAIRQRAAAASTTGEGLSDVLDVDIGLGM